MNQINALIDNLIYIKDGLKDMGKREIINEVCGILHKIERGQLVVLPCEVGSDIYWINEENEVKCHKNGVRGIVIRKDKILIEDTDGCIDEIGTKYCYLSREEAEKALKGCVCSE